LATELPVANREPITGENLGCLHFAFTRIPAIMRNTHTKGDTANYHLQINQAMKH